MGRTIVSNAEKKNASKTLRRIRKLPDNKEASEKPEEDEDKGYTVITDNIYNIKPPYDRYLKFPHCDCRNKRANCWSNRCLNKKDSLECKMSCKAVNCKNHNFLQKVMAATTVVQVPGKGRGLKAAKLIKTGQFIGEYVCVISRKEDFFGDYTYVYEASGYVYDSGLFGNKLRFINHSCSPNAQCEVWSVPGTPGDVYRLAMVAIKPIQEGEEICVDYGQHTFGDGKLCKCRAWNCAGTIGGRKKEKNSKKAGAKKKPKKQVDDLANQPSTSSSPIPAQPPAPLPSSPLAAIPKRRRKNLAPSSPRAAAQVPAKSKKLAYKLAPKKLNRKTVARLPSSVLLANTQDTDAAQNVDDQPSPALPSSSLSVVDSVDREADQNEGDNPSSSDTQSSSSDNQSSSSDIPPRASSRVEKIGRERVVDEQSTQNHLARLSTSPEPTSFSNDTAESAQNSFAIRVSTSPVPRLSTSPILANTTAASSSQNSVANHSSSTSANQQPRNREGKFMKAYKRKAAALSVPVLANHAAQNADRSSPASTPSPLVVAHVDEEVDQNEGGNESTVQESGKIDTPAESWNPVKSFSEKLNKFGSFVSKTLNFR